MQLTTHNGRGYQQAAIMETYQPEGKPYALYRFMEKWYLNTDGTSERFTECTRYENERWAIDVLLEAHGHAEQRCPSCGDKEFVPTFSGGTCWDCKAVAHA